MNRRQWLLLAAAAAGRGYAADRITLDRISILTDECATSPADAIAFARQYGVRHVELRRVPGTREDYWTLDAARLRAAREELNQAGLKVSFLNTSMLKYALPEAPPPRRPGISEEAWKGRLDRETARFENRLRELEQAMAAARILGVSNIRIFTFNRAAEPQRLYSRLVELIEPMAEMAYQSGMRLLIENEASCNVARTAELAEFFRLTQHPGLGINWDPINAVHREEPDQFPEAYALLPKERLGNVQMKAEGLVLGRHRLDWAGIFRALEADGYRGFIGLETHVFDGTLLEKAHLSMKQVRELVGASS